jgi:hypothetical protein
VGMCLPDPSERLSRHWGDTGWPHQILLRRELYQYNFQPATSKCSSKQCPHNKAPGRIIHAMIFKLPLDLVRILSTSRVATGGPQTPTHEYNKDCRIAVIISSNISVVSQITYAAVDAKISALRAFVKR